jgi:hypothetical protein
MNGSKTIERPVGIVLERDRDNEVVAVCGVVAGKSGVVRR